MKNKEEKNFSLLFENSKAMSKDELNATKGGATCGNIPIIAPTGAILGWVYIAIGATQE